MYSHKLCIPLTRSEDSSFFMQRRGRFAVYEQCPQQADVNGLSPTSTALGAPSPPLWDGRAGDEKFSQALRYHAYTDCTSAA